MRFLFEDDFDLLFILTFYKDGQNLPGNFLQQIPDIKFIASHVW